MDARDESIRGLMKLKLLITKLQRGHFFSASRGAGAHLSAIDEDGETVGAATNVPKDVKKGQFAVVAVKGGEPKRFIVDLSCLNNPDFLKLLEEAKEEYGFQQKGVLTVPCLPEELETILDFKKSRRVSTEW